MVDKPLYLISDGGKLREQGLLKQTFAQIFEAAGDAIGFVQLREPSASDSEILSLLEFLKPLCLLHGAKLIINKRVGLCLSGSLDGVHLGAPIETITKACLKLSSKHLVGYSAHGVQEAKSALEAGADYIFLSPIFPTISKNNTRSPLGLEALEELRRDTSGTIFALGGITAKNAASCRKAGASGIATIGSVFQSDNPSQAAANIGRSWRANSEDTKSVS